MTEKLHSGTWYIMPTAFDDDLALDSESIEVTATAVLEWGCDGVTALGFMGEAHSLTDVERTDVTRAVMRGVAGRAPVAIGCTASSAYLVLQRAEAAAAAGAAAVMVAAPPMFANVDLLPDFFAEIAARCPLPIIVQDEPASTGVSIPTSVLVKVMQAAEAEVVKLEAPPTHLKAHAVLKSLPSVTVFGGLGGQFFLQELQRGARGSMTGFAFPEVLRAIRLAWEDSREDDAAAIFYRYLPLVQFEAQPGLSLAVRKGTLVRRSVFRSPTTRGTPRRLDDLATSELDALLNRLGIDPSRAAMTMS